MKKTGIAFLLFLFVSFAAFSQVKKIDSLLSLLPSASVTRQVELYTELAAITRNNNSDTAIFFAKKAYELAENSGNEHSRQAAYYIMGRVLAMRGSFDLAGKYYNKSFEIAEKQNNDSLMAVSLNGIGSSLWQLGKHAAALENHFKALRLREKIKDNNGIATSKTNIGMVYQSQEKLQQAEKYVSEALVLLKDAKDPSLQISTMHTLANIYGQQGKIKEAFALDQEGILIAEKTNNEFAKSLFYDNMGNCYLYGSPPDYTKAIEYFKKTLAIDSAFDNQKQMSDSYVNLGDVFFQQKKYPESIPYLLRCIELADSSGYVQGKLKALLMLSTAYRQSGKINEAFTALQSSVHVKDSLINTSSEARIAEMQTLYETEKKQQQINLQQTQLSKKNYILAGTIILALLLGLLGVSAWLRYRLKQKARLQKEIMNQQDLATRAVIEAEEEERQRIARDLHDGVGQMMSAAKMNLSAFESDINFSNKDQQLSFEKIIGLVDESCKEIRSVSHNMMPNALLKNSLATAVRDFIDKIDKKALQIHLYTEGLDEKLDSNTETVLYRVIQECVNNVIKHANASSLDISIIKDNEGISATIEDNGKGFDNTDKERFEGIGLKNIITRVEYLKGTVDFDSFPGRGTVVSLHVPV